MRQTKALRFRKDLQAELKKKRRLNAKPYKLPRGVQLTLHPKKLSIAKTTVYKAGNGALCLLYFHGGSYVDAPTPFHWRFWQHLTRETDVTIYIPIYGRAPNHHCQRTVAHQKNVYVKLLEQYGAANIVVMGDSAGGGLALAVCELLAEKNIPQPKKLILFSPWLDVDMENDCSAQIESDVALNLEELKFWGECYRGKLPRGNFLASPLYGITEKLPEMHVFVGGSELFLNDCRLLKQIAEQKGVKISLYEWEGMQHVFLMYPIPEAKEGRIKVEEILRQCYLSQTRD